MRSQRRYAPAILVAAFLGFVAGVLVMAVFDAREARTSAASLADDCGPSTFAAQPDPGTSPGPSPSPAPTPSGPMAPVPPPVAPPAAVPDPRVPTAVPELGIDPIGDLKTRDLRLPVSGVPAKNLTRSFSDKRGSDRVHEAIDILAPRHTPVLAVEDGVLVKFFHSKAGGNTIYQFDPASRYAYYYAHLDRYASGVKEGDTVKKGQVIGHVGTTGNAPPNTPHLHFAIFKLTEKKQWWKGTPIDPFDIWR